MTLSNFLAQYLNFFDSIQCAGLESAIEGALSHYLAIALEIAFTFGQAFSLESVRYAISTENQMDDPLPGCVQL